MSLIAAGTTASPARRRARGSLTPAALAAALALVIACPAAAGEIEDVEFAETVDAEGRQLELTSLGLLRYPLVFKAYVAGLYLPPGEPAEVALEDRAKRLEIEYFWSIDGKDFGPAAYTILSRNFDKATLDELSDRIEAMHRAFRDIEPGDRYALTYVPGVGTELELNGEPLTVVPGADFAKAYFSIWLGEEPLDRSLRDQLLSER